MESKTKTEIVLNSNMYLDLWKILLRKMLRNSVYCFHKESANMFAIYLKAGKKHLTAGRRSMVFGTRIEDSRYDISLSTENMDRHPQHGRPKNKNIIGGKYANTKHGEKIIPLHKR